MKYRTAKMTSSRTKIGKATLKILRATHFGRKISVTEPLSASCFSAIVVKGHLPLFSSSNRPFSKIDTIASNTKMLNVPVMQAKSRYPRQITCHQNITEWINLIKNSLVGINKIIQYQAIVVTILSLLKYPAIMNWDFKITTGMAANTTTCS